MPERYYEQRHFIEDISLYFEQMGIPRMAGSSPTRRSNP